MPLQQSDRPAIVQAIREMVKVIEGLPAKPENWAPVYDARDRLADLLGPSDPPRDLHTDNADIAGSDLSRSEKNKLRELWRWCAVADGVGLSRSVEPVHRDETLEALEEIAAILERHGAGGSTAPSASRVTRPAPPLRIMGWSPPPTAFRKTGGNQEKLLRFLAPRGQASRAQLLTRLNYGKDAGGRDALKQLVYRTRERLKQLGAPFTIEANGLTYVLTPNRKPPRRRVP
jgi:hypothetical protein